MNDRLIFTSSGETTVQAITAALRWRGFRVVRTFDLQSTFITHPGYEAFKEEDGRPDHGPNSCQFMVLLVYGKGIEPVVVMLSGAEAQAQLQIVLDATKRADPRLVEQVMAVLAETRSDQSVTTPRSEERSACGE